MMAFVKNIARGRRVFVRQAWRSQGGPGCLRHDEGVIGYNQIGLSCPADAVFHEAGLIVRAGSMDTFATSIRHAVERAVPEELPKPARKIATHQIAIAAGLCPAGKKGEGQEGGCAVVSTGCGGIEKIFHVQKAEIVLTAFANDDLLPKGGLIGIEAMKFLFDLSLKMTRIGADPDGTVILLGPEA